MINPTGHSKILGRNSADRPQQKRERDTRECLLTEAPSVGSWPAQMAAT